MNLAMPLLGELEHEAATTRRLFERVPGDRFDWKPHPKSMTLHQLCVHLASMFEWANVTLATTELDFGTTPDTRPEIQSTTELLAFFDGKVAEFTGSLAQVQDDVLLAPWTLKNRGTVVFQMPRAAVLRSMIFNHLVHHRGQLSVYLRLLDVPLPPIYGPTADENPAA